MNMYPLHPPPPAKLSGTQRAHHLLGSSTALDINSTVYYCRAVVSPLRQHLLKHRNNT